MLSTEVTLIEAPIFLIFSLYTVFFFFLMSLYVFVKFFWALEALSLKFVWVSRWMHAEQNMFAQHKLQPSYLHSTSRKPYLDEWLRTWNPAWGCLLEWDISVMATKGQRVFQQSAKHRCAHKHTLTHTHSRCIHQHSPSVHMGSWVWWWLEGTLVLHKTPVAFCEFKAAQWLI